MGKRSFFLSGILVNLIAYANLSAQVVDKIKLEQEAAVWLNAPEVKLKELCGGLTNTSFMATYSTVASQLTRCTLAQQDDNFAVVRVGKKDPEILGINRRCEVACQNSASQIGIAPKILYSDAKNGILVSTFINGETLCAKTAREPSRLKKIIEILKKCHRIKFREELKTNSIYETIRRMIGLSLAYEKPAISREESAMAKIILDQIELSFCEKEKQYEGLCHCDLIPGNFMDDGTQLWLIDWEYATWGNILFDLASLCIELSLDEQKIKTVLADYFGATWQNNFLDFKLMCAIFNLRNAFWYDLRSKDSEVIGGLNMIDYAKKHFALFKDDIENLLPLITKFK